MVRGYEEYQELSGVAKRYQEIRGEMRTCQQIDEPRLNGLGPVQRRQACRPKQAFEDRKYEEQSGNAMKYEEIRGDTRRAVCVRRDARRYEE